MREMKDSGIEWVGTIPAHWSTMPNKYVMRKIKVINPTYNGENILSLTVNGVIVRDLEAGGKMPSSFDGYQILYKGNLLMCLFDYDVTPRCIGLIKDSGVSSPAYSQFVLQRGNDAAYFYYYYLMVDHTKALLHRAKNLRHSFTEEQLGAIKVTVPPIAEQERIADFLDSQCSQIDAISADIQKEIETLEQYKRSLVFEAISKGINGEKTANASSDIWKEIPQSWKLVDIKYLFEIVKRIAGREGYNILSVTQKGLKVKDISGNQGQIAENYSGYQFVFPSDYVMNHMDLLTGWIDCSDQFGVTSPDYRVFRLRDKTQNDTEYYKYVMQCCYMCRIFYSLGQGVSTLGRWRLQTSAFMNFKVPVPPLHEQKEIARYLNDKCKEIELSIEQKRKQLELLSAYKKSLIYEYVTGKKGSDLMQEVSISTVDEYVKAICDIRKTFHKEYPMLNEVPLFRGQADVSYELLPSIARGRHSEIDITIFNEERNLLEMAKYKLPSIFTDDLKPIELLALAQHHGIPTRLLDVTENALVALYFACASCGDKDGEVIVFKENSKSVTNYPILQAVADSYRLCEGTWTFATDFVKKAMSFNYFAEQRYLAQVLDKKFDEQPANGIPTQFDIWIDGLLKEPLFIYAPFTSIRQKMQQGRYILFPNRIGYDHNGTVVISQEIAAISKDHNSIAMKIQINSASKAQILSDLRLFGISRESLFADSTDTVCEEITKDAYNTIND